jgi:chromosome segregation ATPase
VRFVQGLAQKQNSTELAQLAMRMGSVIRASDNSGDDPFAKVKGLIEDMIAKLEKEAAADAEHKAFCDKELSENEEKEADKQAEIEKLTSKIDQWSARSAQLKEEVASLEKALAELAKSQAEMDKIRAEEKALYDKNRPEMEKGLEGIKLALKILKDYYAQDKAHVAAEGAGAGIVGLLEVVESDFSKSLAEMISTEEASVAEYESQTKQNAVDKTNKEQDVKYKTQEANSRDKETAEAKADRTGVQKELDAVQAVLRSLHEQCDEVATPYEELKRRREAEIAGLKQALEILEGQAVLLQENRKLASIRKHA